MGPEVVIARSMEGNAELLGLLAAHGIEAAAIESIRLEDPESWKKVDEVVEGIARYDWVAFTSPRGVAAFERRLGALGVRTEGLRPKFAAVGEKTAAALREIGIAVDFVPPEFLTSALGVGLPGGAGARVLLLRADAGDRKLVRILEDRGFEVDDVIAYRTAYVSGPVEPGLVKGARVVAFASPSEVEGFRRRLGPEFRGFALRATAACIGPVTALAAEEAGFRSVVFAEVHTLEGLVDRIEKMIVNA